MLRPLLPLVSALILLACGGGGGGGSTDAGRLGCSDDEATYLAVQVVDQDGAPIEGATVKGKNVTTGLEVTAETNAQGTTAAVGQNLGSGTIQVWATQGSKMSAVKQATFTCGECSCTFDPTSITLQINL